MDRRSFLKGSLMAAGGGLILPKLAVAYDPTEILAWTRYPLKSQKHPLIVQTMRPRNFETPVQYYEHFYTPNEVFYVRWHHADYADKKEDFKDYKLKVYGPAAQKPVEFTLDELKKNFKTYELTAVNQCSGNRRGLSDPRVTGLQWRYGALGNAKWVGVRLKDVLNAAGVDPKAKAIVTHSKYNPPNLPNQDIYAKAIPIWKAMDENCLIAFGMNGEELPVENGYPARLVIAGWTATYWIKAVTDIQVVFDLPPNFWYNTAYRLPRGKFPTIELWDKDPGVPFVPITEMVVNSLIVRFVNHRTKQTIYPYEVDNTQIKDIKNFAKEGDHMTVMGVAYDGGYGINMVEVSVDGGKNWEEAKIVKSDGRYSWVQWEHTFKVAKKGVYKVMAKASNRMGQTQTFELIWNPAGYHNNVVQTFNLYV